MFGVLIELVETKMTELVLKVILLSIVGVMMSACSTLEHH